MYEVQIINRGPEGIRSYTKARVTKAGSDELHKRIQKAQASGDRKFRDILLNIELEKEGANGDEGDAVSHETTEVKSAPSAPAKGKAKPTPEAIGGNPDPVK